MQARQQHGARLRRGGCRLAHMQGRSGSDLLLAAALAGLAAQAMAQQPAAPVTYMKQPATGVCALLMATLP